MIVRPILLYAAPIWSNTLKGNLNSLEKVQNKFIRIIANAQRYESNVKICKKLNIYKIN